jgi:threonine synthase
LSNGKGDTFASLNSLGMNIVQEKVSRLSTLKCSQCGNNFSAEKLQTYASCTDCGKSPLLCEYDLFSLQKKNIDQKERSMWRYFEMLPVQNRKNIITLGEGWTPILHMNKLGKRLGLDNLILKDESLNPTGSFKARGLSMAISKAKEFGIKDCIIPTAGNAGGAMAAYCAVADIHATVVMPRHTPQAFKTECRYFGANVIEVDGLISDCAKKVAELNSENNFFDVSTMKEPYRLEGKKTMGYEIAEQLNWQLPDVILYPTGGGTGLLGLWKAFKEMMEMGWIAHKMPRLIAVQSDHCMPVVERFLNLNPVVSKSSIANGLTVPFPFADKIIQRALHETSGDAIAIPETEIVPAVKRIASAEGLLISPEGAILLPALEKLLNQEKITNAENVLLLNTGSAYKYMESL